MTASAPLSGQWNDERVPRSARGLTAIGAPAHGDSEVVIDLTALPPVLRFRDRRVALDESLPSRRDRLAVRSLDLMIAIPAFILTLPLMAFIAVLVGVTSRGPILYRSKRHTRHGEAFNMLKFRTMVVDADLVLEQYFADDPDARERFYRHNKLKRDPRVTRVGRVLRRLSLDELPQLANVIAGHMSIVGPRPRLTWEAEMFGRALPTVQRVKGGLTGQWQVSGRSDLTFDERILLDAGYAVNRSMAKDVAIMGRTIGQLMKGSPGAY